MNPYMTCLAFGFPGGPEWIVILVVGLLIFGKRLPEVGKSLGRSIVEFKKGLKGVQDEIDTAGDENATEMLPPPETKQESPSQSESVKPQTEEKETIS